MEGAKGKGDGRYQLERLLKDHLPGECVVSEHKLVVADFRFPVHLQRSKRVQASRTKWWKLKEEATKTFKERVLVVNVGMQIACG
jgi:hypothetical protein